MSIKIPFRKVTIPSSLPQALQSALADNFAGSAELLEDRISQQTGIKYALSVSSSTDALHLAMCALDLKRGDKVLCPVNSFVDIPEVVRHFDAEPIFVDTLPDGYAMDPDKLADVAKKAQGKKLRGVIVNHPGGIYAPMEKIKEVADGFGLAVIEDATEMACSSDIGSHCDMSIVGFGSKVDNTIDGGVLLSNDENYYERAKLLRNHGMIYTSDEAQYMYDVLDIGCQYRMSDYNALYCNSVLEENEKYTNRRKEIAALYTKLLSNVDNIKLPKNGGHQYTQYIVEVSTNRDAFARKLKDAGVEIGVEYTPLNLTKYYKEKYNLRVFDFPNALNGYQKMMSLPIYPSLSDDEVEQVCDIIIDIAKTHR